MNATFRPAFKYLMYGGLLLLSGLAMFVLSVAHWAGYQLSDVNDRTARLTALLGVAGLGFGGLLTSISQMTRFTIAGETIAVRRPLSVCQFDIGEIRRIIWKLGQPRFELSLASTKLDLSLYSNDEQLAIIRAIRTLVPESVQDNWAEFCHRRALPLREGGGRDRWLMSLPASTRFFQTRKRWDHIFTGLLLWSVVVAAALWIYVPISQVVALPICVCAFWPLIRFATPKDGYWQLRAFGTKETREMFIAVLFAPVIIPLLKSMEWIGFTERTIVTTAGLIGVAVIARLLIIARQMDKRRFNSDQIELTESVRRWEAGEQALAK
jgi:hypothetical protein